MRIEAVDDEDPNAVVCNICFFSYLAKDFFHLPGCDHSYCKNCMGEHLSSNITDGRVVKIKCMDVNCQEEFQVADIKNFGSKKIFNKYTKFINDMRVEKDPNLKWCPQNYCVGVA